MDAAPDRQWNLVAAADDAAVKLLRAELGLSLPAAQILVRRGHDTPDAASAWLDRDTLVLHDPELLPEIGEAATRLGRAIDDGERIVVHGDYDADGISGTALLTDGLRKLGAVVEPFVPDRMRDGYGVADRLVEHAGSVGVGVLITVDTGSSAHEQLSRAKALGIEVIVCDHHLFDHRPDGATWFLNPHREDSPYPNRDLCGCAVAYKLLQVLLRQRGAEMDILDWSDILCIAVLGDQMPLAGENRTLVRHGLRRLSRTNRPGLAALLEVAKLQGMEVAADDVLYQLAPRINATGRVEKARTALQLLLSESLSDARPLAYRIDAINRERRELDQLVTEEALRDAAQWAAAEPAGLVLASDRWHLGVVGISAARVVSEYDLPTVVLAIEGEEARGSARSVDGIDLKAALDLCAAHLTRYGGHAAAAGMTLPLASIEAFRTAFSEAVRSMPRGEIQTGLRLDTYLDLEDIDGDLADFLDRMGPFGQGNPAPLVASRGLRLSARPRVVGRNHLKLTATSGQGSGGFIGFGMADRFLGRLGSWSSLDIAYRIRYREGSRFDPWELTMVDLRESDAPPLLRGQVSET